MPLKVTQTVNEGTSAQITFTITDYNDTPIPGGSIDTATWGLTNKSGLEVINSRTDVDFKSSITAGGVATINLSAADNPIVDSRIRNKRDATEEHLLTLSITATVSGTPIALKESILITVKNLRAITT